MQDECCLGILLLSREMMRKKNLACVDRFGTYSRTVAYIVISFNVIVLVPLI